MAHPKTDSGRGGAGFPAGPTGLRRPDSSTEPAGPPQIPYDGLEFEWHFPAWAGHIGIISPGGNSNARRSPKLTPVSTTLERDGANTPVLPMAYAPAFL